MIEARGVTVEIGGARLLDEVSLAASAGAFLAVVGPNGAGKSTLFRTLAGELRPTRGEVRLGGLHLSVRDPREIARRRAVLPQQSTLAFPLTALEVVLMGRLPHNGGREREEDFRIALESLETVGVADFAGRLYPSLSGGEKQRVQIARVLAQIACTGSDAGRCLLLDEPTSALDLSGQQQTLALFRRQAQEGVTVVAVLHDLNLAARHADRIVMLRAGKVVANGAPAEVLTPETIEKTFSVRVAVLRHDAVGAPLIAPLDDCAHSTRDHVWR